MRFQVKYDKNKSLEDSVYEKRRITFFASFLADWADTQAGFLVPIIIPGII